MFQRRSRRSRETNAELNITAFMNLMVVLVPFLLITAVFSQVSILNLNLPGTAKSESASDEPIKALEVVIRKTRLELAERGSGGLITIANNESGYDFVKLNESLKTIKATEDFKDETAITLLLEEDISYDVLIQAMDTVRMIVNESQDEAGAIIEYGELFPDISIGSAPPAYDSNSPEGVKQ